MILTELLRSTARSLLRLKHVEILNILIKIQKLNSIAFFGWNPNTQVQIPSQNSKPIIIFLSSEQSLYPLQLFIIILVLKIGLGVNAILVDVIK